MISHNTLALSGLCVCVCLGVCVCVCMCVSVYVCVCVCVEGGRLAACIQGRELGSRVVNAPPFEVYPVASVTLYLWFRFQIRHSLQLLLEAALAFLKGLLMVPVGTIAWGQTFPDCQGGGGLVGCIQGRELGERVSPSQVYFLFFLIFFIYN